MIILADHVNLLLGGLLAASILSVFIFVVLLARGKREARVALVEVAQPLELALEVLLSSVVL